MSRILNMLRTPEDPEYHPLVAIKNIADRAGTEDRLEFDCHRTIAKYVEAERKSIDIKTEDGAELIRLSVSLGESLSEDTDGDDE